MATHKHTAVGNPSALDQYATVSDVINTQYAYVADTGAADAYVMTLAIPISAYTVGQSFHTKIAHTNTTTTPTLAVSGLTAGTIVNPDGTALLAGQLPAGASVMLQVSNVSSGTPTFQLVSATSTYINSVGVRQIVATQTGANASGTTAIPFDNTIPQNTEGDQYMTLAITPKSATSKLIIEVTVVCSASNAVDATMALFQDSAANALKAVATNTGGGNQTRTISFRHEMTSGTTSATTFKVRAGGDGIVTFYFNSTGSGQLYGGVCGSSIVITEVGA